MRIQGSQGDYNTQSRESERWGLPKFPYQLKLITDQPMRVKKIPEGKEKNHWERKGGAIPKPPTELGTVHILHNQSQETLWYVASGLGTQKIIALVMQPNWPQTTGCADPT